VRLAGAGVERLKSNAAGATVTILKVILDCGVGVEESVTVSVTFLSPLVANACVGLGTVDVDPSLKSQA
jgi:hypothetical protein